MRNKIMLTGKVANNLTIKEYEPNMKRAYFSIIVHDSFINAKGKQIDTTNRFNVIAWGDLAKLIENNVSIEEEVSIEGKLNNNNYKDQNGNWISDYQVIISKISVVQDYNLKKLKV